MTKKEIKNTRARIFTLIKMRIEFKITINQGMLIMMTTMMSSSSSSSSSSSISRSNSLSITRTKVTEIIIQTKTKIIKMVTMPQNMMHRELPMNKEIITCFNKDLKIIHIEY